MIDQKITIGNVCFIHDRQNKQVLLLKRNREPMKGLYTGVGGKTRFSEDIRASCFREITEETGLVVSDLSCRGVIKTLLKGSNSSWILFVYVACNFTGSLIDCDEGTLVWVPEDQIFSLPLIGFIRPFLQKILFEDQFIEATVHHDATGSVLEQRFGTF